MSRLMAVTLWFKVSIMGDNCWNSVLEIVAPNVSIAVLSLAAELLMLPRRELSRVKSPFMVAMFVLIVVIDLLTSERVVTTPPSSYNAALTLTRLSDTLPIVVLISVSTNVILARRLSRSSEGRILSKSALILV